jgi:folate-binding protein YgfZ
VSDPAALLLPSGDAQVIDVTGEDRLTHLDATTTQALKDARPGTATSALVLDANGNPLAMFDVLVLPDRVWLVTPSAGVTDVVMELIAGRTFLADARFAVTGHTVVRAAVDPALAKRAWSGMSVVPEPASVRSTPTGDTVIAADAHATLTIAGPEAEVGRLADALRGAGAVDADAAVADAWRVATGRPAWGAEVQPPHLPEELGLLPTHVHLAKGCYPGQEAVARMWMLGRPRRHLARVLLEGDTAALAALTPGTTLGEGRMMVTLTTLALPEALAFVPGVTEAGEKLEPGVDPDVRVAVVTLIGDDQVPPGHDPAMRRRRDRPRGEG